MNIRYYGWSEKYGSFNYIIPFDETKTDYELHFKNGGYGKQISVFHVETRDWNCDGDVYPLFGAYFQYYDKNGETDGRGFWTPENMVRALVDAQDKNDAQLYGNDVIAISDIVLPVRNKRPRLEDTMRMSERRSMPQDIERNRRMFSLGIRGPGEPWAK